MTEFFKRLRQRFCRHDFQTLILYDRYCTLFQCRKCEKLYYIDAENDHRETDEEALATIRQIHSTQLKMSETALIKRTKFLTEVASSPESIKNFAQRLVKMSEDEDRRTK